jgi:hypothetical protein
MDHLRCRGELTREALSTRLAASVADPGDVEERRGVAVVAKLLL